MDNYVGVFRKGEDLAQALAEIRAIRERAPHAPVADKGAVYNSNLFHALELENLLDLAEVTVMGAADPRGIARRPRPPRFRGPRRREVAEAHAGVAHARRPSETGLQAGHDRHVEAGGAEVLRRGGSDARQQGSSEQAWRLGLAWRRQVGPRAVPVHAAPPDGPRPAALLPAAHLRDLGARLRPGGLGGVDGPVSGPLFVVGEFLVFAAFAFHAVQRRPPGAGRARAGPSASPIEPVYPYRTSVHEQRPLALGVMVLAGLIVLAGGLDFFILH